MRRSLSLCVLIACALTGAVLAQNQLNTYEQLSVGSSPVSIAAATLEPAGQGPVTGCFVRTESASVRYRVDGPEATGAVGMALPVGTEPVSLSPAQARQARFHGYTSASVTALVNVSCWR